MGDLFRFYVDAVNEAGENLRVKFTVNGSVWVDVVSKDAPFIDKPEVGGQTTFVFETP